MLTVAGKGVYLHSFRYAVSRDISVHNLFGPYYFRSICNLCKQQFIQKYKSLRWSQTLISAIFIFGYPHVTVQVRCFYRGWVRRFDDFTVGGFEGRILDLFSARTTSRHFQKNEKEGLHHQVDPSG